MAFAIKTEIRDPQAESFAFSAQRTMYGGTLGVEGDAIFVLASENEGGRGLVARGVVTSAEAIPRKPGLALQPTGKMVGISDEAAAFLEGFS